MKVCGKQRVCTLELWGKGVWPKAFNPERGRRGERSVWQSALVVDMNLFLLKLSKFPALKTASVVTETTDFLLFCLTFS